MVSFGSTTSRTKAYYSKGELSARDQIQSLFWAYHESTPGPPELIFDGTKFLRPANFSNTDLSKTKFQHVDLSNLSFLHSDISQTKFIACDWGSGYENKKFTKSKESTAGWFHFRRPRLLRDELDWRKAIQKEKPDEEDPTAGDIEVLALQLKQSLEATRDPIAAGDFHFAAMEMKRERALADKRYGRWLNLGLYKVLNGYGERWGRALLWVFLTWLYFTMAYAGLNGQGPNGLYPAEILLGVEASGIKAEITKYLQDIDGFARFRHAGAYALQNLLPFKINSGFLKVSGELIQFLAVVETVVGTTLFTFFVLALRRRFKR